MTSINRHLLPSRNSFHSTSTLLDVTLKALRRCQATVCKFAAKTPALVYRSKGISNPAVSLGTTLALRSTH